MLEYWVGGLVGDIVTAIRKKIPLHPMGGEGKGEGAPINGKTSGVKTYQRPLIFPLLFRIYFFDENFAAFRE